MTYELEALSSGREGFLVDVTAVTRENTPQGREDPCYAWHN